MNLFGPGTDINASIVIQQIVCPHITFFRKVLAPPAQFGLGNGITLCRDCHKIRHASFNRQLNLSLPVDAEGGEKLESMMRLYYISYQGSVERGLDCEPFYSISDIGTLTFKNVGSR